MGPRSPTASAGGTAVRLKEASEGVGAQTSEKSLRTEPGCVQRPEWEEQRGPGQE